MPGVSSNFNEGPTLITFKATDRKIAEMAALATNASYPPPNSPGWIHYDPLVVYEAKDFTKLMKEQRSWVNLDYIQGRCVKFTLWRGNGKHEWKYASHEPRERYQTWMDVYPTYPDLMRAAGIEI